MCTDRFGCQLHGFRPVLGVRYAQPDHDLLLQQQRRAQASISENSKNCLTSQQESISENQSKSKTEGPGYYLGHCVARSRSIYVLAKDDEKEETDKL
jgi:hypothetical protein